MVPSGESHAISGCVVRLSGRITLHRSVKVWPATALPSSNVLTVGGKTSRKRNAFYTVMHAKRHLLLGQSPFDGNVFKATTLKTTPKIYVLKTLPTYLVLLLSLEQPHLQDLPQLLC